MASDGPTIAAGPPGEPDDPREKERKPDDSGWRAVVTTPGRQARREPATPAEDHMTGRFWGCPVWLGT